LLDGFKATVSELPNIPERAMTDLEKKLSTQAEQLGGSLANNFDAMLADAEAQVSEATPQIADQTGKIVTDSGESATKATDKKAVENKAVLARSSEGQSVFAQMQKALGKGTKEKQAQQAAIDSAKDLHDIAREVRRGAPLVAKDF